MSDEPEAGGATLHTTPSGPGDKALSYWTFRRYAVGSVLSNLGMEMLAVAVSWQIYNLTGSALALGLVGLAEVVPVVGLAVPAGHLADQLSRRRIVLASSAAIVACCLALAFLAVEAHRVPDLAVLRTANRCIAGFAGWLGEAGVHLSSPVVPILYLIIFVLGINRALGGPARSALLPTLVPQHAFPNAVTWNSSFFQLAAVAGPALGGLILGLGESRDRAFGLVYLLAAASAIVLFGAVYTLPDRRPQARSERASLSAMLAGLRFVWGQPAILGAVALDMFAVLLGGATALLPVYADRILHVGPRGLGLLRAAPSVGALLMAVILAHRPPIRRAGPSLIGAVIAFGLGIIVFGISSNFWLSLSALFVCGVVDNISVVVRHTLVQVLTPDSMRGRVSAVNQIFISLSNEFGALESGTLAAAVGPVVSVVAGGIGTVVCAVLAALLWPQLRRFGSLAEARPVELPTDA